MSAPPSASDIPPAAMTSSTSTAVSVANDPTAVAPSSHFEDPYQSTQFDFERPGEQQPPPQLSMEPPTGFDREPVKPMSMSTKRSSMLQSQHMSAGGSPSSEYFPPSFSKSVSCRKHVSNRTNPYY
eukprot:Protomagalhaensia_wolfi_Nauph_80__623@NODE_1355_length_1568_cov_17_639634_g1047_i0_p2_GENE_NODE_1355_length_1568_cov_17_639634_g1047_i0NODE_1355_length_1568_cov_17_639634_g1047_i0_p2_ORF_typecomplete_len126_score11_13GET2/PF08690_10/1_8_NODE_1355_length_1568_cov_17_639634_g1047_i07181095